MVTVIGWLKVCAWLSIAVIVVKLYSFATTVGVPDKTPDWLLNVKPGSNFPVSAHVKGGVPPVTLNCTLNGVFTGADTLAGEIALIDG